MGRETALAKAAEFVRAANTNARGYAVTADLRAFVSEVLRVAEFLIEESTEGDD